MRGGRTILTGMIGVALCAAAAVAKPPKDAPVPAAMVQLTECRKLTDAGARLACFDREVAALEEGVRSHDVTIVNRAEMRQTRRSLFGIPLPSIKLFGGDDDEPEAKEITAVLSSVSRDGEGRTVFTLEDGAVWTQTDDFPLSGVKAGQKVVLRRAALGSYFAKFEKTVGVRAKRLR